MLRSPEIFRMEWERMAKEKSEENITDKKQEVMPSRLDFLYAINTFIRRKEYIPTPAQSRPWSAIRRFVISLTLPGIILPRNGIFFPDFPDPWTESLRPMDGFLRKHPQIGVFLCVITDSYVPKHSLAPPLDRPFFLFLIFLLSLHREYGQYLSSSSLPCILASCAAAPLEARRRSP